MKPKGHCQVEHSSKDEIIVYCEEEDDVMEILEDIYRSPLYEEHHWEAGFGDEPGTIVLNTARVSPSRRVEGFLNKRYGVVLPPR